MKSYKARDRANSANAVAVGGYGVFILAQVERGKCMWIDTRDFNRKSGIAHEYLADAVAELKGEHTVYVDVSQKDLSDLLLRSTR